MYSLPLEFSYTLPMRVIEGSLPEDKRWRALVGLAPGETLGISWRLGLNLARANHGETVVLVVVREQAAEEQLAEARRTTAEARAASEPDDTVHTVIISTNQYRQALAHVIDRSDIDLLLIDAETPNWPNLDRMPCAVAAVRGEAYYPAEKSESASELEPAGGPEPVHILVPTSGGPNSVHALSFLLPLTDQGTEVTALYIAPNRLGPNEEALGRARLRQTLNFIDANDRIKSRLISAESVIAGIVDEAQGAYDLVVVGASLESSFDKVIFGNIPAAVVRQSKTPVVVVRQPSSRVGNLVQNLSWSMQRIIPRMNLQERTAAYVRIRRGARPDRDFFALMGLATLIAALGLLVNSAAVVIGAMLVAPLMSPVVGIGLAIVLGDTRFLRLSGGAVARGVLESLFLALLVGLLSINRPLTGEILARTEPTLFDLGIAVFSGMAAAYALCRSEAAAALPGVAIAAALVPPLASAGISLATGHFTEGLGALLLFSTNIIAISTAAALVFLVLGFRPAPAEKLRRSIQIRSARAAFVLLVVITAVLGATTLRLARDSSFQTQVRNVAEEGVAEIVRAELVDIRVGSGSTTLELALTVRSDHTVSHASVVTLQRFIATEIQREVALTLTVIPSTTLDPFVPPTLTPTAAPNDVITPIPASLKLSTPTPFS
jgi:uncharacterized hydrophobic protein (TIGR00271 family)